MTAVGPSDAKKKAEAVLRYVFRIAFTASLLRKSSQWKMKFPITWISLYHDHRRIDAAVEPFPLEIGEVGD